MHKIILAPSVILYRCKHVSNKSLIPKRTFELPKVNDEGNQDFCVVDYMVHPLYSVTQL